LGHLGVARELAAIFSSDGFRFEFPSQSSDFGTVGLGKNVLPKPICPTVSLLDGCNKYIGARIENIEAKESPFWVRLRLCLLGLSSISPVVDASQLVMLETGNPLHVFDANLFLQKGSNLSIGLVNKEELFMTLDGVERMLQPGDLVVTADSADGKKTIGALAGVIGGQSTQVTLETKSVFIEAAEFDAGIVRATAKRHKLQTEASYRFERGIDEETLDYSINLCIGYISAWTGGNFIGGVRSLSKNDPRQKIITWNIPTVNDILGLSLSYGEQQVALSRLGFSFDSLNPEGGAVIVPSFRKDITRFIDLVEEIGRMVGYDRIPSLLPRLSRSATWSQTDKWTDYFHYFVKNLRDTCVSLGLTEVKTLPFVKSLSDKKGSLAILLQNPLGEETSCLRMEMAQSFLPVLARQVEQGAKQLAFFELGEIFSRENQTDFIERTRLACVLFGNRFQGASWSKKEPLDFYDAKGLVEEILLQMGFDEYRPKIEGLCFEFVPWKDEGGLIHPNVAGQVRLLEQSQGIDVGFVGELHPQIRQQLGIQEPVFWFELAVDPLFDALSKRTVKRFIPWPKFPVVRRDLSFFVEEAVPFRILQEAMHSFSSGLLEEVSLLEDYREKGKVPEGKKALLLQCTYRMMDRTLRDEEVKAAHEALVDNLQKTFGIEIR